jgi:hypothetical protein
MTPHGKDNWRQDLLRNAVKITVEPAEPGLLAHEQGSFFPEIERDKGSAACIASAWDQQEALRRLRILQPAENHDYGALGYPTKGAFRKAIKKETSVSERTQQRWAKQYREEGLRGLLRGDPGPPKGTGGLLDTSEKGFLELKARSGASPAECYRSYLNYLRTKQDAPDCRVAHVYRPKSYSTIKRYLHSLNPIDKAAPKGPDAVKAVCGHLDRDYDNLPALGIVECDEWKYNLFAFDPDHPRNVYRYWLLLFLDVRSIFPLVWKIVRGSDKDTRHGISEEDEIELTEKLIREYGVPRELSSDRGRFRGATWGGQPTGKSRDAQFQHADGILDALGITYNRPRESNPRGMRVHPLFHYLSNQCQGLPGYIGRNTVERKGTRGDFEKAEHLEWAAGRRGIKSPLLSVTELSAKTEEWLEWWRNHPSEGTSMRGLSPRAIFVHNTPPEGFRRISDVELAFCTAEHFSVLINKGGIVQLRDGKRYSDPQLLLIQGQHREAVRLRHNHEQISVLPSAKGEEAITAKRRARVGVNEPDQLAAGMELQNRVRRLAGQFTKPLDYDPQSLAANCEPEAPKAAQRIPPQFIAAQEAPEPEELKPLGFPETGSVEWQFNRKERRPEPWDFADLES